MRTIAYALNVVSTVLSSLFIIPLIWMIPMTIASKQAINDDKQHLTLAIFIMLFIWPFGLISGILLLVPESKKDNN